MNVDPVNVRPDICHQVHSIFSDSLKSLLALLDSPLNKAGHLQVCLFRFINPGIRAYNEERVDRDQPSHPHSAYLQSICRSDGYVSDWGFP